MTDTQPRDLLHWWEKASAGALFIASGLYAAEWYIGARMPPQIAALLPWIVSAGGLVTLFAIDGALVSTVMGARAGRRSVWTWITIGVSALFGALVALVLHGALPGWVGAWLHAGFMATIASYLMHLAQPRQDVTIALALREQEADRREADLTLRAAAIERQASTAIVKSSVKQLSGPTPDKRKATVKRLVAGGTSKAEAGRQVGVTRQTVTEWLKGE